jgi:hypothetical protein
MDVHYGSLSWSLASGLLTSEHGLPRPPSNPKLHWSRSLGSRLRDYPAGSGIQILVAAERRDRPDQRDELESRRRPRPGRNARLARHQPPPGRCHGGPSLAAYIRRPRVDYESHAVALDRNELGALLVAAGLGPPAEHALISLLALNGLRVSEATSADIEQLGLERGHRTLTITRKGGKVVTIPLAPRTARAIDLAIGECTDGPVFLATDGGGWTGTAPGGSSARPPAGPGSPRPSRPTLSGMRSSPPPWMPGCRCATSERQPRMLTRGRRCGMTGPAAAWTGTPRISSPPTSQALPGNGMAAGELRPAAAAAGRSYPRPPIPTTTRL